MNAKQLLKTLQFSSPRVIYIINFQNKLKALRTPFKVRVIKPVNDFTLGQELTVDRIWNTDKLVTVFEIKNEFYQYHYFDIVLEK
ncbi:hypothetical protein [Pontimicrobium aquaticum]|uniref:Uncharacterized protein n=1 Tax=Pontimicrobium aquaticum TaxID=2565367 RepID=A0A4U0F0P6_9FLAO|nr:hypothetical protein [Pontimicrobium aquaticum]TJY37933.1 hypothetical protein E5167_01365 [Pontimicrobium aquaticum]